MMRNLAGGRVLAAAGGCLAIAGCTALAGIQDGQLVATGTDSGGDVTTTDGNGADTRVTGDGPDTGGDVTSSDSSSSGGDTSMPPMDGGDGGPTVFNSTCYVTANSTMLVDDLSMDDSGAGRSFDRALWVLPAGIGDGTYVVTQGQNEQDDFLVYQVDFGQQKATTMLAGNQGSGGVRLLDVEPGPNGPLALASFSAGANQAGLESVALPSTWNGPVGAATSIVNPVVNNAGVSGGTIAPTATQPYWLISTNAGTTNAVLAGVAGTNKTDTLLSTNTNFNVNGVPYFHLGSHVFAFIQGLTDGGNTSTVLQVPDNFTSPGLQAPIQSSAMLSAVIGAHVSASDSTMAALLGISLDSSGNGQIWAGASRRS
jgi:hypothetical protein